MKPPHLNDSQWKAVCHEGSHLLITAGPGTGKTHTLIHRMCRIIPTLQSDEKILGITFTNKAAQQMKDRLTALGVAQSQTFIGTFHSFCLTLLRSHLEKTALPKDFKVVLPDDIEGFEKNVLEQISLQKSTLLAIDPDENYKSYQRYLRQNSWIDFDDILREALTLLEDEDVAHNLSQCYRHIFVDEYQDSNVVQNALLKALAIHGVQITAIGDPKQSIYGFRGSNVGLFHRFKDDFLQSLELTLEENYRSASNILKASSQMIGGLELLAKIESQGQLIFHEAESDRTEAEYVAQQIEGMVGGMDMRNAHGANCSFADIAIVYRLNSQRHALIQALDARGIPYQVSKKPSKPSEYSDEAALGQFEETFDYNIEKVSLLTFHAAKGLEFPVVFIVGCEEHILPLDLNGMKGDVEEERRLLYVGMTRAKKSLYLTYANRRQLYGKTLFQKPSPFLLDIAEDLKAYALARRKKNKMPTPDDGQMKLF